MAGVSFGDEPRPPHRLVVTAAVEVDIGHERTAAGQLLDISIQGAYVAIASTEVGGGLVRLTFGLEGSTEVCIAYGRVSRFVNLRESSGVGIRFTQHNPPFAAWIARVRSGSPSEQMEALTSMRSAVLRLR